MFSKDWTVLNLPAVESIDCRTTIATRDLKI